MCHSEIVIREATLSDIPAMVDLFAQLTKTTVELSEEVFQRMSSYPFYKAYVATLGGGVVGTLSLMVMDNMGHAGSPIGVIENVYVEASHHRKGIGKKMIVFASGVAKKLGCYKIILASHLRLSESHAFYESLGFEKQGYAFSLE